MTGSELKEFFEELVDDTTMSTDTLVVIFNTAKNKIEAERDWEVLKDIDTSNTATSSDTYLTAKTLPATFYLPIDGALYVGDDPNPFIQIPFDQRERWKNTSRRWYINRKAGTFHVCGGVSGTQTLKLPFIASTTDFTSALTESPTWPSRFHPLIAYEAAKIHYAKDAGEKGRSWAPEWNEEYKLLKRAMVEWDVRMKLMALENKQRGADLSSYPDIVA